MAERGQGQAGGPRVACLGECMVELRTRPDGLLSRAFGGDTLNTAVYLARLGVRTDYVSALGDDDFSADMVRAWEAEGVGTAHVLRLPGHLPGLYIIETDAAGERRFLHWRDSAPVRRIFDPPHADATEAALLAGDVLYLSGISLSLFRDGARARLLATLERAREAGVRVVFDTNFRARGWPDRAEASATYDRVLGLCHTVLAGVDDFRQMEGAGEAETVLARLERRGVAESVVKLPEPGCLVSAGGKTEPVSIPSPVVPIDTTAAGDSFAAGYLAARLSGRGPAEAALAGHIVAGAVIRHPGAIIPREAMPPAAPRRSA